MKKTVVRETRTPQSKQLKLLQLIDVLKAGRWTITQLTDRFDCSRSTMFRYLKGLSETDCCIEQDPHNRYFMFTPDGDLVKPEFTVEEMAMMRALIQTDAQHPLKNSVKKKLSQHSELQQFLKTDLGRLIEQLTHAMRNHHQVTLKKYHSANSKLVRDRLVEPIQFGPDYASVIALDVKDKVCKQFKLDRIGEVAETHRAFQHKDLHQIPSCDIFGLTGKTSTTVTLYLSPRAYLLLREEHPLALPYLSKAKNNKRYTFIGPVSHYAGIGRFVTGLFDEIDIVGPEEFKTYVRKKLRQKV